MLSSSSHCCWLALQGYFSPCRLLTDVPPSRWRCLCRIHLLQSSGSGHRTHDTSPCHFFRAQWAPRHSIVESAQNARCTQIRTCCNHMGHVCLHFVLCCGTVCASLIQLHNIYTCCSVYLDDDEFRASSQCLISVIESNMRRW